MKNWKTTAVGVGGAIMISVGHLFQGGQLDAKTVLTSIVMAAIGFFAKDAGATGEGM